MTLMRHARYWTPVFLWMGLIFYMSTGTFSAENTSRIIEPLLRFLMPSVSPEELAMSHAAVRKTGHVAEYFILSLLLFNAFRGGSTEKQVWQWVFYSLLAAVLYAAGDELHQSFVSTRTAALADICFDVSGAISGLWASVIWHRRIRR